MTFRPTHNVGPRTQCISGLNHAAYGLPVNASRPGSPQAHASLGSGWRPTLAGWDWIAVPAEGVEDRGVPPGIAVEPHLVAPRNPGEHRRHAPQRGPERAEMLPEEGCFRHQVLVKRV